ncbi:uncharacterized protein EI97DRAFT_428709 [Westerdykella ornata]|uniref:Uncharacterized protein n=1 Tax=Westerdykella ornata TaxID=318751 RepID=A0A6A6JXZ0_WESOR|nr:uncharacterized protein EI97DRAFT_428709 [Westerdykella ornata]KAF2280616.1 hypothetical protein EI97DRAFT_428709 [Westerdykella ornata]
MPLLRRTHRTTAPRTTRTTRSTARPSLRTRILGPKRTTAGRRAPVTTTTTTTTTTKTTRHHGGHMHGVAAAHPRRRVTMGDKVSGALMKLRGSLTRRPGLKAAGTRRMHGTDGRTTTTTRRRHL